MATPFVGQLALFPFNFAPTGWALCQGQLLAISQNTALFSLLGTNYGGDGRTTFGLPNLQVRVPIGVGAGPGLTQYNPGDTGGVSTVTLTANQCPTHNHNVNVADAPREPVISNPVGTSTVIAKGTVTAFAAPNQLGPSLAPATLSSFGTGPTPHDNNMPYLVLNWCIALQGVFPVRN